MTKETNLIYKPVEVVSPYQANRLGVATDKPVFLEPGNRILSALGRPVRPLVYQLGSVVEAQCFPSRERIFAFPDLQTTIVYESVGYFGFAPFTGFIAMGEAIGEHVNEPIGRFSDLCIRTEKMRVLGIKAFIEESEITKGSIAEFIDSYIPSSYLVIAHGNLSKGRIRYAFRINKKGEVEFRDVTSR